MPKSHAPVYRAAIVGLGRIGSRYQEDLRRKGIVTHAAAYRAHPLCRLVAGFDVDAGQRRRFADRWKTVKAYGNLREMMTGERPDIVSLCTPAETHEDLIRAILPYRPQAIFCEKPMAADSAQAERVQKMLRGSGVAFSLNVSRRWDRMHQRIKKEFKKKLGRLQTADAYYTGSFESAGAHLIDALRMFCGDVAWVQVLPPLSRSARDGIQGVLGFRGGGQAFLHHLNRSHYLIYELDFYGTKGRVRIVDNGFESQTWKAAPNRWFSGFKALAPCPSGFGPGYRNVLEEALKDLIRSLEKNTKTRCGLEEGAAALCVQDALLRSARSGGKKISVRNLIRLAPAIPRGQLREPDASAQTRGRIPILPRTPIGVTSPQNAKKLQTENL